MAQAESQLSIDQRLTHQLDAGQNDEATGPVGIAVAFQLIDTQLQLKRLIERAWKVAYLLGPRAEPQPPE
ncbi:MAG: hypothetical protein VYD91_00190 [Pseudomonadota bacterium]|nr:hypothetical protein [Pseudomonadota bacterium]MEE2823249.1 hypothetical protein [Pseudomonadota bacterium]